MVIDAHTTATVARAIAGWLAVVFGINSVCLVNRPEENDGATI